MPEAFHCREWVRACRDDLLTFDLLFASFCDTLRMAIAVARQPQFRDLLP